MSNRLTFSLASLIFLITLGLVFAPTAVMAHDAEQSKGALDATSDDIRPHDHPLNEPIPAITGSTNAADDRPVVERHGVHPVPMISLKSGQDNVRGTTIALDSTDNTTFTLVVDYGRDVTPTASNTTATGNTADGDLTIAATSYSTLQVDLTAAAAATLAVTRVADSASQFEVVVTPGLYPDADTAATATNDDTLKFKIQLPAGGLFGLQTRIEGSGVTPVDIPGGQSSTSALYTFTLVKELPAVVPPTAEITAPDTATVDAPFTATLTFSKAVSALTMDNIMVTGGQAGTPAMGTPADGTVWTVEITPLVGATEVTVTVDSTVAMVATGDELEVTATTPPTPVAPDAPTDLAAVVQYSDDVRPTIMLNWEAPEETGTEAITGYTVTKTYDMADGTAAEPKVISVTAPTTGGAVPTTVTIPPATEPALPTDVEFTFTVTATSDAGTSDPSNEVMATIDGTPPTVVISPPDAPDTDGNLTFTFDFSEEVNPATITLDRSGPDNVRLGENSDPMVDDDDNTIYTILVTPVDATVDTTVLLLKGSVKDLAFNGLAGDSDATYSVPVTNTPPTFEGTVPNLVWCEGVPITDVLMPLARDSESAASGLTYSLHDADGNVSVEIPENSTPTPPAMGLYWVNVDDEQRYIRGEMTERSDGSETGTTYEWRVTDEGGLTNLDAPNARPLTFTITVTRYKIPNPVTNVMATKVNATALMGEAEDANKVKLTWMDPNPTIYPNNNNDTPENLNDDTGCIHPVASYKITRQKLSSHLDGRNPLGTPVHVTISKQVATTTGNNREYTTGELEHGTYEFTVTAVNRAGESMNNSKAVWEKTGGKWVIVDDPPKWDRQENPANLRSNETDEPMHSITLDWRLPDPNFDAPVDDTQDGLAAALYGTDANGADIEKLFGGYHLEVTNQTTDDITIYPEDYEADPDRDPENLIRGNKRTFNVPAGLAAGEYTVRVVAHNVIGKSLVSESHDFEIDVHDPGPPTGTDNKKPSFGPYTIADMEVEVGDRIGLTLGAATDPEGDAISYSLSQSDGSALPEGLSFNASSRRLSASAATAAMDGEYTYAAFETDRLTANANLTFYIEVVDPTVPPTGRGTVATSIPANGFIVYVRDLDNPPHFGTSSPMVAEWSDMPNLYEFFTQGGGGSLQLNVTGVTARQVVFNEVMWAVDLGKVGQASYAGNQWIELRNRTDSAIDISNISFMTKNARPALAEGTDLISNVVGGGNAWIRTKGQNGNSGAADGSGQVEFISMRRSNYGVGWNGGHWTAATQVYHPNNKGTPGKDEPAGVKTFPPSGVALNTVFNEIGNYPNSDHEWIELRIKNGDPNFENYVVDMVTGASDRDITTDPKQERLFKMPKLDTGRYDNILLITKTDPYRDDSHPLRGGYNVEVDPAQQKNEGRDENIRYYVADDWNINLPDDGEFVLILRHNQDRTNHERVEDLAGYHPNLKKETADFFTNLWPLIGYHAPNLTNNKIAAGQIDRRVYDDIPGTRTKDGNKVDKVAFRSDNNGWTGVGYKRNAAAGAQNGGTPGYPNNALTNAEALVGTANPVVITEIMYATGERGNLPQWVELRNTSKTSGINLDGWKLAVVNHDQDSADAADTFGGDLTKTYGISGKIPPGETFLIVAHSATDETKLPSDRIKRLSNKRG